MDDKLEDKVNQVNQLLKQGDGPMEPQDLAKMRQGQSQGPRGITDEQLQNWFTYHSPDGLQAAQYGAIRAAALEFARIAIANSPSCEDQSAGIRLIREAVMTLNAAVACGGK